MKRCWFCNRSEGNVRIYAMRETPLKPAFDAHEACVKEHGANEALVEVAAL